MRPHTVHQIHIDGRDRNAAQRLAELQIAAMRLHLDDYRKAGVVVPDAVRETAVKMGIEVEYHV